MIEKFEFESLTLFTYYINTIEMEKPESYFHFINVLRIQFLMQLLESWFHAFFLNKFILHSLEIYSYTFLAKNSWI